MSMSSLALVGAGAFLVFGLYAAVAAPRNDCSEAPGLISLSLETSLSMAAFATAALRSSSMPVMKSRMEFMPLPMESIKDDSFLIGAAAFSSLKRSSKSPDDFGASSNRSSNIPAIKAPWC